MKYATHNTAIPCRNIECGQTYISKDVPIQIGVPKIVHKNFPWLLRRIVFREIAEEFKITFHHVAAPLLHLPKLVIEFRIYTVDPPIFFPSLAKFTVEGPECDWIVDYEEKKGV